MRYVRVTVTDDGTPVNFLDPAAYLGKLPELQLPAGARAFATDPGHFDFASSNCVKDLRLGHVTLRESGQGRLAVELALLPNRFKHDSGLLIRYDNVAGIDIEAGALNSDRRVWPESPRLGDLQLDEILPAAGGCSHELKFTGGSIVIVCEDLHAEWTA